MSYIFANAVNVPQLDYLANVASSTGYDRTTTGEAY